MPEIFVWLFKISRQGGLTSKGMLEWAAIAFLSVKWYLIVILICISQEIAHLLNSGLPASYHCPDKRL